MREPRPYKVSEITHLIKNTLESSFYDLSIEGEISNFKSASSGHFYFTLKDDDAVISAVMFRNRTGGLSFKPEDGRLVTVYGNISVYAKRGNYQIICERMEEAGVGKLLLMLEERKKRFAAMGYFDPERKRPLPLFPSRIAVITSPTGAAVRDILQVLRRRNAGIYVVVLPCPVQGNEAAQQIAAQIRRANMLDIADVLIVGRGGGSLEDLLPFSEEAVVEAVVNSRIPVISAVGHEIDISLSDLAADYRAPTPSAAAEVVSESGEILAKRIQDARRVIMESVREKIQRVRLLLDHFTPLNLERNFRMLMQPVMQRLDDGKDSLIDALSDRVRDRRHQLEILQKELISCSPYDVLKRGYALVSDAENGTIIKDSRDTDLGRLLEIKFYRSGVRAEVRSLSEDNQGEKDEKF
jgi:exodeoxyribonuclease VII large subunit